MKPYSYDINLMGCVYDGLFNNITIIVNGKEGEEVNIIFSKFKFLPDYVYINKDYNVHQLVSSVKLPKEGKNTILLIWINTFKSCENMFQGCNSKL